MLFYNPSWTITTQQISGYYFNKYGKTSLGLPIPPDAKGTINKDGSYAAADTGLGWLVDVRKIKVMEGEMNLVGPTGHLLAHLSKIDFSVEVAEGQSPFNDIPISGVQVSLPGSPLSIQDLQFSASTDGKGSYFAKDIKATTNLGSISGSFQYTQRGDPIMHYYGVDKDDTSQVYVNPPIDPPLSSVTTDGIKNYDGVSQLTLHSDGITYNNFAGIMGYLPNLFQNPNETPISFDSQWTDLEYAHPRGTGHITLAPSHLSLTPALLQPLTLIHWPGYPVSSPLFLGKIDPVSGSSNFNALLDLDKRTALVNFQDMHCLFGLPLPSTTIPPVPSGKHGHTPPAITGSTITSLEAVGSGSCDFTALKFTSLFHAPIKDPAVAEILTSATHAKEKIGNIWTFQVLNTGDLRTLRLETGKPVPPTPPASSSSTPTPAPARKPHH
jgi:hypothetical protein